MRLRLLSSFVILVSSFSSAESPPYQLKNGEFPPLGSERRASGELVEADFIHRVGQFRKEGTGEIVDFSLTPYAAVRYRNAEADLRDIPLGTRCEFFLFADAPGAWTKAASVQAESDADPVAAEEQRKKHNAFLKVRGLPAWIDRIEGRKLTVTFFGDPAGMQALFKDEGIEPERWAKERRRVNTAVANEELRTYNPPVDKMGSTVLAVGKVPVDNHGCSGEQWVIEPSLLLEGFRKGRVVRIFVHPSWPIADMPFGEGLYSEVFGVNPSGPEANQFPFRTDFGNGDLPWYRLQPGEFPPHLSEHRVGGELVKADVAQRTGQFRMDRTGELVDFTLLPFGSVMALGVEADLRDLQIGTRCQFYLHPDEKGAFTKASVITDEYTRLASDKLTYRVESMRLEEGKLFVAWQIPPVENDKSRMEQPPDFGRGELAVDDATRVWKGDQQVKLGDIVAGDALLANVAGRTVDSRGRCTDIWVGTATHEAAGAKQRARQNALLKERGLPAWVERVEGKRVVVTLFYGTRRKDFKAFFDANFKSGQEIQYVRADSTSKPIDAGAGAMTARLVDNQNIPTVAYGCSGRRIAIEPRVGLDGFQKGDILRLSAPGWPVPVAAKE